MAVIEQDSNPPSRNTRSAAKPRQPSNPVAPTPRQVGGKPTSTVVNRNLSTPTTNPSKPQDEVVHVPVLILGAQGCGKSSLINAALDKPVRGTSNGLELGTKDFHFDGLRAGKHKFMLVDSPGFDNALMSDGEVMTKLIRFLCCGKSPTKIAGVIYVHSQETRLGSGILKRNLCLLKSLFGDSFMDRFTILVVPRPGEQIDQKKLVQPLLDPKSPFYPLYDLGAQVDVSALETQSIRNTLLPYVGKAPALAKFQHDLCKSGHAPTDTDISDYLVKCARTTENRSAATRPKITASGLSQIRTSSTRDSSSEVKKLQLQLAESKKQTEGFSAQLQQHLDQYTSLRSQLQINENIEQKDITQHLIDLNRRIEDLALSLSQHLVDTYGGSNIPTTLHAYQLPELKGLFGHEEGKASLVLSSKGVGMQLEDFLDVAIRSILCEQIYKRVIGPFHPGLAQSDPRNKNVSAMYAQIREKESQATLGRWRTASFTAISGLIGEQALSSLKSKVGLDILNENLMPMLQCLFGPSENARPRDIHVQQLSEITTQAWDWCVMLKEKIVLLGDFQPVAYRYGRPFDHMVMSEFEPRRGGQTPTRILSTIALGLNVFRGQSSGEGSERVVLCKTSVVTEGWFERH